jgi:uncharacterized membrane protein
LIPESIFGIPAHPLLVHAVVVLLPLSAIGMIAMVFIPPFRGKVQKFFVAGTLVVATGSAFLAKESGETLRSVNGVSEYHQEWGSRTFYAALALVVLSSIWFWLDTKPRSVYKRITGLLVVLVSLAAITATVLAGHSGAQSVWELNAATATDISSTGTITINEVALHATVDDCWSVVNGNVYDLTQWINEHPGGSGPVESMCGIDASTPFNNQHNGQGEPETALASFQIGILG